jgi:hypothetical protein
VSAQHRSILTTAALWAGAWWEEKSIGVCRFVIDTCCNGSIIVLEEDVERGETVITLNLTCELNAGVTEEGSISTLRRKQHMSFSLKVC